MSNISETHIPGSIAIIMDGNGRWAQRRGLPRNMGHREGCKTVEQIIEDCAMLGVGYLTVYAFSTENWRRSEDEVSGLMQLFRYYAGRLLVRARDNNVRVRMIGDRSRFPRDIIEAINKLESETRDNTGMTFVMAANYGGRDEIVHATKQFAKDAVAGNASPDALDEALFSSYLYTKDQPDIDLIIRPSGEMRLSNFLLWQAAYAEYVFMDVLWPDFNEKYLEQALSEYANRNRRFGGV